MAGAGVRPPAPERRDQPGGDHGLEGEVDAHDRVGDDEGVDVHRADVDVGRRR